MARLAAENENEPATEQVTEKVATPEGKVMSARAAMTQVGPVDVRMMCIPATGFPSYAVTENTYFASFSSCLELTREG